MRMTFENGVFICFSTFQEKDIPKGAGFLWNRLVEGKWATKFPENALKLASYADDKAAAALHAEALKIEESWQTDADIEIPVPKGLIVRGFQKGGVAYMVPRRATLIGDDMGLGKTIQVCCLLNVVPDIRRVLIICPASLKRNWEEELTRWLVEPRKIGIAKGKSWPTDAEIVIINYDIVEKHYAALREQEWDLMVCDEVHYLRNRKTKRVKNILGHWNYKAQSYDLTPIPCKKFVGLSGTLIVNRPRDLYPVLHYADPKTWRSYKWYADKFCGRHWNGFGWDDSGATNLDELQRKLRATLMIRRTKAEVLKELPPKVRQIVELPSNGFAGLIEEELAAYEATGLESLEEARLLGDDQAYADAVGELQKSRKVAFTEMAKARHRTALAKLPLVLEFVRNALENVDKLVVFAHHKDVVKALLDEFPASVSITGETPADKRQDMVRRFQTDPTVQLFVGNIQAAGVGHTLTASSTVIFAELSWVPGEITQAEDRCHRMGQEDSVLVQHLVFERSLDAKMARTLVAKQEVIHNALDSLQGNAEPEYGTLKKDPRKKSARKSDTEEQEIKPAVVEAIHEGLKRLARVCDYAHNLDGMGFNAFDADFGHSLAERSSLTQNMAAKGKKLIIKYQRQLPKDLVELVKQS